MGSCPAGDKGMCDPIRLLLFNLNWTNSGVCLHGTREWSLLIFTLFILLPPFFFVLSLKICHHFSGRREHFRSVFHLRESRVSLCMGCTMFKMANDFDLCGIFSSTRFTPEPSSPPTILTSWHIARSLVLSAHLTQTGRISSYEVETSG